VGKRQPELRADYSDRLADDGGATGVGVVWSGHV